MRAKIAEFRGWKLEYDPYYYYGPALFVEPPEDSDGHRRRIDSTDKSWWGRYTTAEMLMLGMTHIQNQELRLARERNEIAMAQDLAKALIEDNLLGAIE